MFVLDGGGDGRNMFALLIVLLIKFSFYENLNKKNFDVGELADSYTFWNFHLTGMLFLKLFKTAEFSIYKT